jgi:hypothetical protein
MTMTALLLFATAHYVTVAGLGGEPDYELRFKNQAEEIEKLIRSADPEAHVTTLIGASATKAALKQALARAASQAKPEEEFVLMLIGHGTYDGVDYKINLPGPDITAAELATELDRIPSKRQLVVNMTSASGGSLAQLQKPGRIVIASTRSGMERNAPVFARYWVEALRDPAADSDKNEVITALEAYRYADQKTVQFYETEKRLATEHAVLEDTGDGEGVRAPSAANGKGQAAGRFAIVRLGDAQRSAQTPEKAALFRKKEELEVSIDKLKYQKAAMPAEEYKRKMQALLLELARLQEEIDQ